LQNEFIESLHHKSWIVQIPYLKKHRRDDLEKLLSIFDQSNIADSNYILKVNENDFPEQYRHIIRRLKQAAENEEIEEQMIAEYEILGDFQNLERRIEMKDEMLEKKDKTIEEKSKMIEEKDRLIEDLLRQINQK